MLEKKLRNLNDGQERIGMQGGDFIIIDNKYLENVKMFILNRTMFGAETEVGTVIDGIIKGIDDLAKFHNNFVLECEKSKINSEWARYALEKIIPDKI